MDVIAIDELRQTRQQSEDSISIVIPFYNEAGNVTPLIEELHQAMQNHQGQWELVAVNDGSRDTTANELHECQEHFGQHIHIINFARNFGQTAAMQAGIEAAQGDLVVTLDGDRQNDPADIPKMIEHLYQNDLDMVAGWRKDRQDGEIDRKLPSKIANWIIRRATGVTVSDYGCSLKLYRRTVIQQVVLLGEMHRFIPAWVASVTDPKRIGEVAVNHRAREIGESKYGISRTFRVILDLLVVMFFMRFARRPGHFFGQIGLGAGAVGGLILSYLLALKITFGADIGGRPLLFTGILLVIAGIQFITTGVLAEIMTRNGQKHRYPTRGFHNQQRTWQESA